MRKQVIFYLPRFILALSILEISFYAVSWFIPSSYYYKSPTRKQFLSYLADDIKRTTGQDPQAGQRSPEGFRFSPAGQGLGSPCVSLYGDSMTFGAEVSDAAAWGNVLTELLGCRVDNYGVSGYGTDQAYLDFKHRHNKASDKAPIVILSHLSENIVRNITQNFSLIYNDGLMLKPRFIIDGDGSLRLIEKPHLSPDDWGMFVKDMGKLLQEEFLLPDKTLLSKRRMFFPHFISVPYVFTYKRIYASMLSTFGVLPWFSDLYDPKHPSQALQITRDILSNFYKDAKQYAKTPIIFILPTSRDLIYFQKTGKWSYANLLTVLSEKGILQSLNLGPQLLERIGGGDLCDYFCTYKTTRSGHYTEKGNRVLAEVARDAIVRLSIAQKTLHLP